MISSNSSLLHFNLYSISRKSSKDSRQKVSGNLTFPRHAPHWEHERCGWAETKHRELFKRVDSKGDNVRFEGTCWEQWTCPICVFRNREEQTSGCVVCLDPLASLLLISAQICQSKSLWVTDSRFMFKWRSKHSVGIMDTIRNGTNTDEDIQHCLGFSR